MLEIKNLKAEINNKKIIKGLNLKISQGEVHAIMGPNGSGKSTLANILSGKPGYDISGDIKVPRRCGWQRRNLQLCNKKRSLSRKEFKNFVDSG